MSPWVRSRAGGPGKQNKTTENFDVSTPVNLHRRYDKSKRLVKQMYLLDKKKKYVAGALTANVTETRILELYDHLNSGKITDRDSAVVFMNATIAD